MPNEERLPVVQNLLEQHGWRLARVTSSHHIFKKLGASTVSIPVHRGRVKPAYVRKIKKLIEEGG